MSTNGDRNAMVGRVLDDRYLITQLLGEGAMGAVYVADHLRLNTQVALKIVHKEFAGESDLNTRFAREAMAVAQFQHPNVAAAVDYGPLPEGGAYFVMELVLGCTLEERLDSTDRLAWSDAASIGAQIADALVVAAKHGIVHRDLKPANIMLQPRDDGTQLVKVLDFGIARFRQSGIPAPLGALPGRHLTVAGTLMGTPGYMSPEQSVGETAQHASDLYSLGIILWESIAGQRLWNADTMVALFAEQQSTDAPALRDVYADGTRPPELDDLIAHLLVRDPNERPLDAAQVRGVLRRIARMAVDDEPFEITTGRHAVVHLGIGDAVDAEIEPDHRDAIPDSAASKTAATVTGFKPTASPILNKGPHESGTRDKPYPYVLGSSVTIAILLAFVTGIWSASPPHISVVGAQVAIPDDLAAVADELMTAPRRGERAEAASTVIAFAPAPSVPPFLLRVAMMQQARRCVDKKHSLGAVIDIGDARALPALHRMRDSPTRGCGPKRARDCLGCLRTELDAGIAVLFDAMPPQQ